MTAQDKSQQAMMSSDWELRESAVSCRTHGELCYMKHWQTDRNTHFALWGAEQIVEEDGTPPVHPVDALPDADASAGLLITFILKQQACQKHTRRRSCWAHERYDLTDCFNWCNAGQKSCDSTKGFMCYIMGYKERFWLATCVQTQHHLSIMCPNISKKIFGEYFKVNFQQ